jgi:hypothetical protein
MISFVIPALVWVSMMQKKSLRTDARALRDVLASTHHHRAARHVEYHAGDPARVL